MNEDIALFLQRLEWAKEMINSLTVSGSNLDRLIKVETITFGESVFTINRKENEDIFNKLLWYALETEKSTFEKARQTIVDILDGKLDEQIKRQSEGDLIKAEA